MAIYEKLAKVQQELKAPKGQYNSYGGYRYRSCEDILEAVKPLLIANGLVLTINDDVVQIGDRYYIKATAIIKDINGDGVAHNTAYAREDENKKGMDGSQITGTASSYARKYALNGLFLIDDTKDADTEKVKEEQKVELKEEKKASDKQIEIMRKIAEEQKKPFDEAKAKNMSMKAASDVISKYKGAK